MLLIRHYFRRFRAGTVSAMDIAATLATAVTGGVLLCTIQSMLGTAAYTTILGVLTESTTARGVTGFLLGASKIERVIIYEL